MKFYVMDQSGHSTIEFDKTDVAVSEAMAKFAALVGAGHVAATRKAGAIKAVEGKRLMLKEPVRKLTFWEM